VTIAYHGTAAWAAIPCAAAWVLRKVKAVVRPRKDRILSGLLPSYLVKV